MVGRERGNNAAKMYKDPYKPFLIRPIQAYYPPGSSFKPLKRADCFAGRDYHAANFLLLYRAIPGRLITHVKCEATWPVNLAGPLPYHVTAIFPWFLKS
jgi:hypothetical protein